MSEAQVPGETPEEAASPAEVQGASTKRERMKFRARRWVQSLTVARGSSVLAAVLVLVASLWVRVSFIHESLPYCRHMDEKTWTEIAMRIARDGDLNPHRFTKPSVMVYLTTGGLSLGLIRAEARGEAKGPKDLGERAYPHYVLASALEIPKLMFAAASVAALGFAGMCAWVLGRNRWLFTLAPLLAAFSSSYFAQSWEYINADIIGAFFVLATLAHLLFEHRRRPEFARGVAFALIQGLLAGLALGSKYNLYPIILPYLIYTLAYRADRLITRWLVFLGATLAGFVISTPYALFAMHEFLAGSVREAQHYATSHFGQATDPGFRMFSRYFSDFRESYGLPLLFSAALGLGLAFKRDFRLSLVLFSFPIAFLAYMSSQRVFFARNVVSVHLFIAIAAAIGLAEGAPLLRTLTEKVRRLRELPLARRRALLAALLFLFLGLGLPWSSAHAMYTQLVESRNLAQRVIAKQVPAGTELLVDDDLFMDLRPLKDYKITSFDEDWKATYERFLDSNQGTVLVAPLLDGNLLKEAAPYADVLLNAGFDAVDPLRGAQGGNPKLIVLRRR